MGGATKPKITNVDPNSPALKPLQGTQTNFLQGLYGGGNPFATQQSQLGNEVAGTLNRTLSGAQPASVDVMSGISPALLGLLAPQTATANTGGFDVRMQMPQGAFNPQAAGGALPGAFNAGAYGAPGALNFQRFSPTNTFAEQGFGAAPAGGDGLARFTQELAVPQVQAGANPFYGSELANPFGSIGAMNPALAQLGAMTPIFDRNLQAANTQLSNAAPGRFSSAFVQQGQDLSTRALQDYNLFAQQTLQQGQALQLQQQQAALNFALGARDIAQRGVLDTNAQALQAQTANAGNALQARSLAQQAAGLQGQLGVDAFRATTDAANASRANAIQAALGFAGINADQTTALNQAMLGQRGQNIDALLGQGNLALGGRGQDINALNNLWQAQLGASGQANQFALGAQGLAQDAFFGGQQNLLAQLGLNQQGILGGAQTLGSLGLQQFGANQDAQNAFIANLLGAGNFGLAQQQANVNPILQLMLGGLQYGQPQPMNTVVGQSGLQQWGGFAKDIMQGVGSIINPFGGKG